MSNEELEDIWRETKERPGYIANLFVQSAVFVSAVQVMLEAFKIYDSIAITLVYGMFGILSVDTIGPKLGRGAQRFVNAAAELKRSFEQK